MNKTRFLPGATKDYEEAFDWYRTRSERGAAGFEEAVERALEDIIEAPNRWPFCDPRHRQRRLRKYPHSIVYRFVDDTVVVVAVAHPSRRSGFWRRRQ